MKKRAMLMSFLCGLALGVKLTLLLGAPLTIDVITFCLGFATGYFLVADRGRAFRPVPHHSNEQVICSLTRYLDVPHPWDDLHWRETNINWPLFREDSESSSEPCEEGSERIQRLHQEAWNQPSGPTYRSFHGQE